ncbi:MAG: hypothetical protein R3231_05410 [bacterium]|nr:hypothetical protein [bacterium]
MNVKHSVSGKVPQKVKVFSYTVLMALILLPGPSSAHFKEPLGTEIADTPLAGRFLAHLEYDYAEGDHDDEDFRAHSMGLELEIGIGDRSQLNLEAEFALEEKEGDHVERGIDEIAFGAKHRFYDETDRLPDFAFLLEFAPGAGLSSDESEFKASILMTKNFTPAFLTHLELGYILETESGEHEEAAENTHLIIYNLAPMFQVIHDRLMVLVELNGESNFDDDDHAITLAPELIYEIKDTFFKVAVPIGLTDEAPDIGIRVGISRFF